MLIVQMVILKSLTIIHVFVQPKDISSMVLPDVKHVPLNAVHAMDLL
jgi:hypothetical protein